MCPAGLSVAEADALRQQTRPNTQRRSMESMARHVQAMLAFQRAGPRCSITATTCASAPSTTA
jgi:urocanate hydratase